ncbi:MAG: uridine kinase [Candidatus Omnitrophota bacterium]
MQNPKNIINPKLIAIMGPSAAGKTYIADYFLKSLGRENAQIISQDWYYCDWSSLPKCQRSRINFDHPGAFDFELMIKHLKWLKQGQAVKTPVYSYKLHKRLRETTLIVPKPIIFVEGLYTTYQKRLRDLFDFCIYVDIDPGIALARRIRRDGKERGRSIEEVCSRFFKDVYPMQKKYLEKQRKYVDMIISCKGDEDKDMRKAINKIKNGMGKEK